jgi:PD-(D/E)XK nuclease superfamily
MGTLTLQLSHSELRTWRTCHRKWYLQNYLEWGPGPDDAPVGAASLGTRVHLALEGHYGHGLAPLAVLDYLYQEVANERPDYSEEIRKEHEYATLMVEGYLQWSAEEGVDAGYRVLATETEEAQGVTLPGGQMVIFRGKLDQIVEREIDGAILFRDWKTVGSLTKANLLILDTQMRFYAMLQALEAKDGGLRADGGLYTMLLRSKRTERAKGPFYQQVEVHLNHHDLNSMWLHSRAVAQEIVNARERLDNGEDHREIVYASPGDHCRYACPFVNVCPLLDDGARWQDALAANFQHCDANARYTTDKILSIRKALSQG